MQVLRLLAARRADAVRTTITAPSEAEEEEEEDEGPFFDLDFASVRAASSSSSAGSASSGPGSESDDAFSDLDLTISLHRSRSASPPSYEAALVFGLAPPPPPLLTPSAGPRSLSLRFGASSKAALYGARSSSARSSSSGARSLRLFMEAADREGAAARPYSGDVIRRCLTRISRRLRRGREDGGGTLRRLRKSRSAGLSSASRRDDDDSVAEKQDGIASAIAHCKESLHRASLSTECDSPLLRSRSDPGKREPEGS